jgi:small-conductance mechanosensitive channel
MKNESYNNLEKIYELLKVGSPDNELIKKAEKIDESLLENLEEKIRIDREYRIGVAKLNRNTFLG